MNFIKMNPAAKRVWINALRSGKYKQGQSHLRTADAFCCLGVLCDVHDSKGWVEKKDGYEYAVPYWFGTSSWKDNLPIPLVKAFGVDGFAEVQLIKLNDEMNLSFAQIADFIEQEL